MQMELRERSTRPFRLQVFEESFRSVDGDDPAVGSHDFREVDRCEPRSTAEIHDPLSCTKARPLPRGERRGPPHPMLQTEPIDLFVVRAEHVVVSCHPDILAATPRRGYPNPAPELRVEVARVWTGSVAPERTNSRAARPGGSSRPHTASTKSNVAERPSAAAWTFINSADEKIPSVAFRGSAGKYSCVVSTGPFGDCTLTWMCRVRPG
jgi:hypothetical protein